MRQIHFLIFLLNLAFVQTASAQTNATVDGYAFESGNRGYLNQVDATVYKMPENSIYAEAVTMEDGHFELPVEAGQQYKLVLSKDIFHNWDTVFTANAGKNFFSAEMKRQPGYLFDVTLAEPRTDENVVVNAVEGATIEVYNRTKNKEELVLKEHPKPYFQFTFEQGNYYTIMIRKAGYLTKRIEAHVNIDGCIICIDGVNDLRPGVVDNLTEKNTMGTLLANIEIQPAEVGGKMVVQDLYYDYNQWELRDSSRKELDKVVLLMKDNPAIKVELGSHTDSRGKNEYNMELSQKRAESAVEYIVEKGIDSDRISAKGYGETQLANNCKDGIQCSEAEHQENRRTELSFLEVGDSLASMEWQSLREIIREEEYEQKLKEIQNTEVVQIGADGKAIVEKVQKNQGETLENAAETSIKQAEAEDDGLIKVNFDAPIEEPVVAENLSENDSYTYKKIKYLAEDFSGFNIKIASDKALLSDTNPMFENFNSVYVKLNEDTKLYDYFVGIFTSKELAEAYSQKYVKSTFPLAEIANFFKGKRL